MGLSGTDIPVEARMMALADVFDALVSKRCYKDAFSYDVAFCIIEEALGEHLFEIPFTIKKMGENYGIFGVFYFINTDFSLGDYKGRFFWNKSDNDDCSSYSR